MSPKSPDELKALTKAELAAYAAEEYGISLDQRKALAAMLADFEAAAANMAPEAPQTVEADTETEERPATQGAGDFAPGVSPAVINEKNPQKTSRPGEKRMWITVHNGSGSDGESDVFVAVNGRNFLIQREKKVPLPVPHVEVLEHAEETAYRQIEVNGKKRRAPFRRRVYNMTIHGPVIE